jgi:co-chaperonin GroES (HSP10)
MMMSRRFLLVAAAAVVAAATTTTTTFTVVNAMVTVPDGHWSQPTQNKHSGGAGVGRLVIDEYSGMEGTWKCHYDMVLVERIQKRKGPSDVDENSLYVPDDEQPRLHLCKILSVGNGREEENGTVAPDLDNLQPGDMIYSKHPWGIGPKDEELADGTKLSFIRTIDVAAKINGELN